MNQPANYPTWCERYGDDYTTEAERRSAYGDYCANHAELTAVFGSAELT